MKALELADWVGDYGYMTTDLAAVTLRKQHYAIVTLRAALQEITDNVCDPWADGWCGALADTALEATKEFV